jgi:hypothetical protein
VSTSTVQNPKAKNSAIARGISLSPRVSRPINDAGRWLVCNTNILPFSIASAVGE